MIPRFPGELHRHPIERLWGQELLHVGQNFSHALICQIETIRPHLFCKINVELTVCICESARLSQTAHEYLSREGMKDQEEGSKRILGLQDESNAC